jgi:hypothetical protein
MEAILLTPRKLANQKLMTTTFISLKSPININI